MDKQEGLFMSKRRELSMRVIRELLRLALSNQISARDVGRSLKVSHPTVQKYVQAVKAAGLDLAQIEQMDDEQLRKLLQSVRGRKQNLEKPLPDYEYIHQELKKPSVTMYLLWQEYLGANPTGYQMAQFRRYYYQYVKRIDVTLRQRHKFGESMFVDYAGQTMPIYDRITGQVSEAQIFVAVLGGSNYTYAESTADQSLPSWTGSHVRSFEYFGGVPERVVPDNLKSGVTKACRYEPDINPTYREMAAYYKTVVMPARVRHPKDKAKVESAVLIVERWILASLRNRKFFSLGELNQAIRELLIMLNQRKFKKLDGSRESVFLSYEKQTLKALPDDPWEYAQWKRAKVNMDYHIELLGHYYSVPYVLVHESVDVRYTSHTVEIFHNHKRVASHVRDNRRGVPSTVDAHMPKCHQEYIGVTPSKLIEQAKRIGERTAELVEYILHDRKYPPQGYRSCLGIMRLARNYPILRLEGACARALSIGGHSYTSVAAILKSGLDQQPIKDNGHQLTIEHDNIRGGGYFNNQN
jgi:transposase